MAEQSLNVAASLNVLHRMIESCTSLRSFPSAITWTQDGSGFVMNDKATLHSKILPMFFPEKRWADTFYRSLNRWGIKSSATGCVKGVWSHQHGLFYRGSHGNIITPVGMSSSPNPQFASIEHNRGHSTSTARSQTTDLHSYSSTTLPTLDNGKMPGSRFNASIRMSKIIGSSSELIDRELADFFDALKSSITEDMLRMNPDRLVLTRVDQATVLVVDKDKK
mmetsp:Transcript_571/g.1173  ORF Transcript_571/g.1173 Transcript_571/m.1173 type:complete len:222 (-) Transcript_571:94-759(-)